MVFRHLDLKCIWHTAAKHSILCFCNWDKMPALEHFWDWTFTIASKCNSYSELLWRIPFYFKIPNRLVKLYFVHIYSARGRFYLSQWLFNSFSVVNACSLPMRHFQFLQHEDRGQRLLGSDKTISKNINQTAFFFIFIYLFIFILNNILFLCLSGKFLLRLKVIFILESRWDVSTTHALALM